MVKEVRERKRETPHDHSTSVRSGDHCDCHLTLEILFQSSFFLTCNPSRHCIYISYLFCLYHPWIQSMGAESQRTGSFWGLKGGERLPLFHCGIFLLWGFCCWCGCLWDTGPHTDCVIMADFPSKVSTETSSPQSQQGGSRLQGLATNLTSGMDLSFVRSVPAILMMIEIVCNRPPAALFFTRFNSIQCTPVSRSILVGNTYAFVWHRSN